MVVALTMAAYCATAGWGAYAVAPQRYVAARVEEVGQRTTFHAQNLRSTLARHGPLPRLAMSERVLHAALQENPRAGDAVTCRVVNTYLKEVQAATDLVAAHLINMAGLTIAASNWDLPALLVGQNYALRLYFIEVVHEGLDRFYGIGNITGETNYFVTASVRGDNKPIGVVVMRVNLGAFEATLSRSGDTVLPVDRHGVIFLSPVPEWKYRTLDALNVDQRAVLDATHQHAPHILIPLDMNGGRAVSIPFSADHPSQIVRAALPKKSVSTLYVQYRSVDLLDRQVAMSIDPRDEQRVALVAGASVAFTMVFIFAVLVALCSRQRQCEEQHRACAALYEVQRDLEAYIAQHTAGLMFANIASADKAEALDAVQRILREIRDATVQAGEPIVLGQMTAGIMHELNQPPTALTTLPDNVNQLAEHGRIDEARGSLTRINQLVGRMGRTTPHVKAFSCEGDAACTAAPINEAIRQVLVLVETHRRQAGVAVTADPVPASLAMWANAVRLEQMFVNLIRNAIDATAGALAVESLAIRVSVESIEKWVRITVRDFGPDIPAGVLPRLFEPSLATKDDGQDLGLDLAISLAIIEGFGGRLEGCNAGDGAGGAGLIIEPERAVRPI